MPSQDKKILDYMVSNIGDPNIEMGAAKLGLSLDDVKAYKYITENPDIPEATAAKNKIFTKVAEARPVEEVQKVGGIDRFAIKNLIENEPKAQSEYLQKKGYQTRIVGDRVEAKRPEDIQYGVIDPEGIDLWDVTDVVSDIGEAIATGIATGAKVIGAIGAPATGGASLLAGSIIGGVAASSFEAAKQGLGKSLGVRQEFNPAELQRSFIAGATAPVFGRMLGTATSSLAKSSKAALKPAAAEIKEAAKLIGAKATPGQVYDSKLIQALESVQFQSTGKLGGMGVRRQIAKNISAAQKTANEIVSEASEKTSFEVGEQFAKDITEETSKRLAPAEAIYDKYETIFSRKAYKPSLGGIRKLINNLKDDFELDDNAIGQLEKYESKLDSITDLTKLKKFRTLVRDSFDPLDKANTRIVSSLNKELTNVRSDTLKNLAKTRGSEFFNVARQEIEQADSIYKGTIRDIEAAILEPGKGLKFTPKKEIQNFLEKNPEISRINKVLSTSNPKKIEAVKRAFPQSFETLRQGKIQEIADRSMLKGEVDPAKLSKIIDKLPKETVELLFDGDKTLKARALKTYLDALPPKVGPSGTPEGIELFGILNVFKQVNSLGRSALSGIVRGSQPGVSAMEKLGRALNAKGNYFSLPAAASEIVLKRALPTKQEPQGLTIPTTGLGKM